MPPRAEHRWGIGEGPGLGLAQELALALYADGLLSLGKAARQLAGLTKQGFAKVLARSRIPRHYTGDELRDDILYAGGQ